MKETDPAPAALFALCSRIIFRFPMSTSLDQIVAATRRRVADMKRSADVRQLEQRAERHVRVGSGERWQRRARLDLRSSPN